LIGLPHGGADAALASQKSSPNPRVHCRFGMSRKIGQRLPFDVGNQRAIMANRGFLDIQPTRDKLVTFIHAAKEGRYYRPMDAVGRHALLGKTASDLGGDALLKALTEEIRDIKRTMSFENARKMAAHASSRTTNMYIRVDEEMKREEVERVRI
jgi:hypothetical protein